VISPDSEMSRPTISLRGVVSVASAPVAGRAGAPETGEAGRDAPPTGIGFGGSGRSGVGAGGVAGRDGAEDMPGCGVGVGGVVGVSVGLRPNIASPRELVVAAVPASILPLSAT
jgi:hypothetical protein